MARIAGGIVQAAQAQVRWAAGQLALAATDRDRWNAARRCHNVARHAEQGTSLLPCIDVAALRRAEGYLRRMDGLLDGSARILIRHELRKLRQDACWYKPTLED